MANKNADEWSASAKEVVRRLSSGKGFSVHVEIPKRVDLEEMDEFVPSVAPEFLQSYEQLASKMHVVGRMQKKSEGLILESTVLPQEALEHLTPNDPGWFCVPMEPPLLGWQAYEQIGANMVNQKAIQEGFLKGFNDQMISMGCHVEGDKDEEEEAQSPDNTP